jgi:valyl-tRNA synthetase
VIGGASCSCPFCLLACLLAKARLWRRDAYRLQLGADAMHAGVVSTYIDASVRILAPIAPHWADHVYRNLLKAGETVLTAGWPQLPPADAALRMAADFIDKLIPKLRVAIDKKGMPKKNKGVPLLQRAVPYKRRTCNERTLGLTTAFDLLIVQFSAARDSTVDTAALPKTTQICCTCTCPPS